MATLKSLATMLVGAAILLTGLFIGYKVGHAVGYVKGKVSKIVKPFDSEGGWWPWRPRRPDNPSPEPPDDRGSPVPDRGDVASVGRVEALVTDGDPMDAGLIQRAEQVPVYEAMDFLEIWVVSNFGDALTEASEGD